MWMIKGYRQTFFRWFDGCETVSNAKLKDAKVNSIAKEQWGIFFEGVNAGIMSDWKTWQDLRAGRPKATPLSAQGTFLTNLDATRGALKTRNNLQAKIFFEM